VENASFWMIYEWKSFGIIALMQLEFKQFVLNI